MEEQGPVVPKIGGLVRANIAQMIEFCEQVDPEEIANLSDAAYCKATFNLNYPFFRSPAEAEWTKTKTGQNRYWVQVHRVLDHDVRVTSQWYEKQRADFLYYLEDKGLTPIGVTGAVVEASLDHLAMGTDPAPKSGARYKLHAIGNAQNAAVRNVLSRLGEESFTAKDWLAVKRRFSNLCAYCSSARQLVMDHAVPISRVELGEHRLGNLVPACRSCNSTKGQKRYDDFLRAQRDRPDSVARIAMIEEHMAFHGYAPLTDVLEPSDADKVRELIESLRIQVAEAATATVASINELLPN